MNIEKAKDKARKFETKGQNDKAIGQYVAILEQLDGTPDLESELALFNKVGDLYLKTNNVQSAVETYERAADLYEKAGFPNNAIALCNKILRNAPGRTNVYLKLAKLMMQRGFTAEAKTNLLEYAERMQKGGQIEQAFRALKEFADMSPENEEIRLLLAEQLKQAARTEEAREQLAKLYAEVEAEGDERKSRSTLTKLQAIDPDFDPAGVPKPKVAQKKQKSSDLVFLNLDDEPAALEEEAPAAVVEPEPKPAPQLEQAAEPEAEPEPEPVVSGELEIETTALVEEEEEEAAIEAAPQVETDEVQIARASAEYLTVADDIAPVEGLDVAQTFDERTEEAAPEDAPALEIESTALDDSLDFEEPEAAVGGVEEIEEFEPARASAGFPALDEAESEPAPAELVQPPVPADVEPKPVVAAVEEGPAIAEVEQVEEESASLEVPDLDLGDLDVEEVTAAPLEPPTVEELEANVADEPDDPAAHRSLGEALIEQGERERGLEELDHALTAAEGRGDWDLAEAMADEIIRLNPASVRHHQKRVEYAYRRNDKDRLVRAYLTLADSLFRQGQTDRARAVYQRVIEHEPDNPDAKEALATLEPEEAVSAAEDPSAGAPAAAASVANVSGDFVDLGALVLEEGRPRVKDTRMRIEEEEPTGDEERDFADMLSAFKKGIQENVEEEDWQAHYDLGVAFKEMGLLDEAIGEFQKALKSPEGRLRSAEALGNCFFEKGQFSVAATVLKRAVDADSRGDDEKIGLLYLVGRAEEEQGRTLQALDYYQRVFAIDIDFQDVSDRVKTLANAQS